jgi:acyl-CoA thioester hydrolase
MIYEKKFIVNEDPKNYIRHVNNLRYLEWFIETAIEHSDELGWGMQACKDKGLAWVAASHNIEYKRPAYQNDKLLIKTWITNITHSKITRVYECYRDEKLITKASTVWVLVDYHAERPRAIPKDLKDKFLSIACVS